MDHWRWRSYGTKGQAERQHAFFLLLRACGSYVEHRLWVLQRCREMQPGMHRKRTSRRRLILFSWSGKRAPSLVRAANANSILQKLYNDLTYMYPSSRIWIIGTHPVLQSLLCNSGVPSTYWIFTGHSLGGSVSSLIGVTFGAPVVAFEAPAEKLAATRLHLPSPVCLNPRFPD